MANPYTWTDNPTEAGIAEADPDILNECLMWLKQEIIDKFGA